MLTLQLPSKMSEIPIRSIYQSVNFFAFLSRSVNNLCDADISSTKLKMSGTPLGNIFQKCFVFSGIARVQRRQRVERRGRNSRE